MNAPLNLADFAVSGETALRMARRIIRDPRSSRDEISAACDVLVMSGTIADRIQAREARHALWAQVGAELRPEAQRLAERLHKPRPDPGLGPMAHHFAALKHAKKRAKPGTALKIGVGLFLAAALALIVQTAWAKTERTLRIYEQIEATNG